MLHPFLEQERVRIFDGEDKQLYLHLGYFLAWYTHVEFKITVLMAIVMGERNFEAFDQLVRGMDAETKVIRLKQLCRIKKRVIEPYFKRQLDHFQDKICKLRNQISHRALLADGSKELFHFLTLEKMPWKQLGIENQEGPSPDHLRASKLFERAYWMNHWGDDLSEVVARAVDGKSLGTENPHAPLPEATPANQRPEGQ